MIDRPCRGRLSDTSEMVVGGGVGSFFFVIPAYAGIQDRLWLVSCTGWQPRGWSLSFARPNESNQRKGRPGFPAPARSLRYSTGSGSADLARRMNNHIRVASSDKSSTTA